MNALVFRNGSLSYMSGYRKPKPGQDEALIRVLVAGICSTDLEIIQGYMNFHGVPGHEFVGVVEDAEEKLWVGKRVVGTINVACQQCNVCLAEGPEHCPSRSVLGIVNKNGAFAEYLALPVANLLEVPENLEDSKAVFTEPLAAAIRICDQIAIRPSARTAVVGPGRLGILISQVLVRNGTDVTLLGRSKASLELGLKLGLQCQLIDEAVNDSFDFVVEATGNQEGFKHSLRLLRPKGIMILKSTFAGNKSIDLTKLVVSEITVIGSRCGPFAPALRLMAGGGIKVTPLIDKIYPLQDGVAAFEYASRPGVRKVLLKP